MKTAEEILKEHTINYGGIDYVDFDHALKAMKIYANSKLDEASVATSLAIGNGKSVLLPILLLKDTI